MEALILAAGGGSRLGTDRPKCLAEVGGRPLVEHQLDALEAIGVRSIVMVVGYEQEQVREAVGRRARYAVNEDYASTNSLYSFSLARHLVRDEVVVLNSDVLFPASVLDALGEAGSPALALDSTHGADEEEMKVDARGGRLVEMGKDLPAHRCAGENLGILQLSAAAAHDAFVAAERIAATPGHEGDWVASAINLIAWRHRFACVDVAGTPWIEIDYPVDLERARRRVWPAMCAQVATDRSGQASERALRP